jgi:hypothetical protein
MARVSRSGAASDAAALVEQDPPPDEMSRLTGRGRRSTPAPRPRAGDFADASNDVDVVSTETPSPHDGLIDAAQEAVALDASSMDGGEPQSAERIGERAPEGSFEKEPAGHRLAEIAIEQSISGSAGDPANEPADNDAAQREQAGTDAAHGPPAHGPAAHGPAEHGPAAGARARRVLSERDRAMLRFERFWWRHAGSKEQAIRETFELSATHYYRVLNALLDVPAAAEFDPLVVGRLRRLRASRARRRAGR